MSDMVAPAESLFLPGFAPAEALADGDLVGDTWCQQHGPAERRPHGITLTPAWLVQQMLALADVPAVTRAREIIDDALATTAAVARLKRVVNLPQDLDAMTPAERAAADVFLATARRAGADQTYVARQRKPWHWLAMRAPPAALVSYMGRRPPVFRANPQQVSYLNFAHGLYPAQPLPGGVLAPMLAALNRSVSVHSGRMYGGGLVKFEPSDIARLRLPPNWQDSLT